MNSDAIKLDGRLKAIVELISDEKTIVDVGCDHGLIPNYLIENNLAKKIYASDISKDSLQKNIELTQKFNNQDKIISVLGDGLKPFYDTDFDAVIIAGMGGELISKIIKDSFETIKNRTLILQPMTAVVELREYLAENGFKIIEEKIVKVSKKYYEIFKVKRGFDENSKKYNCLYGYNLIEEKNPLLIEFIEKNISELKTQLKSAEKGNSEEAKKRCEILKEDIKIREEILNECQVK